MKCETCQKVITGDYEVMGDKNYCTICYPDAVETENQRLALISYIIEKFQIPKPTGFMFGQMKRMKNKYTYKNMRLTLQYAFDVVGLRPDKKYGISVIEYYHDDMIEYYKKLLYKSQQSEKVTYDKERVVKIKSKTKNYKKDKIIDMSQFDKED